MASAPLHDSLEMIAFAVTAGGDRVKEASISTISNIVSGNIEYMNGEKPGAVENLQASEQIAERTFGAMSDAHNKAASPGRG